MDLKKSLNQALETQVSRKEFMVRGGLVALALLGLPAILKALTHGFRGSDASQTAANTYGGSAYGGHRPPTAR
jgi:hypothetical protein